MDRGHAALSRRTAILLAAAPVCFLAVFFIWPMTAILVTALTGDGGSAALAQSDVLATWSAPGTARIAWFTLWQAGLSTVLTVVVALPGAYVLATYDFPGKRLLRAGLTVPFVLPTVVVAAAFLALIGPRGPLSALGLDGTIWAILAAHVFYEYAIVVRLVGSVWSHLDPRTVEAARMLGATPWRSFRYITWPLLRPAVISAASLVFLFTFTSFGVILLLGGSGTTTLEVAIYRATARSLDLPAGAALALLQMAVIGVVLVVETRLGERLAIAQRLRSAGDTSRRPVGRRAKLFMTAVIGSMMLYLGTPLAVLVERSLRSPEGSLLSSYRALLEAGGRGGLFVAPAEAVINSVAFAALTVALAVTFGLLIAAVAAYRGGRLGGGLDTLAMLPLGTSAVLLGFGFIVALDEPPLDLRTSPLLIPLAHTLVATPFVVRAAVPLIRSIEPRLREAAAVLGASPGRVFREIDGPVVARAALVGAGFAFAVSLGEFGATLFIARPETPTVPVAIYRLLGQPGALPFGQAMAMSTILMCLTAGAVLLIERWRSESASAF